MTYAYDNANRLTSVTDWNSNSTSYSYDDAGRMTATTLPSGTGIVSAYTYDNADRLTNIAHLKGGSTTIASVDYTLDNVGNRTQRVDQQGTHTYVYDDLHRLTSVTYPGPSTTTYDFDAFGNREEMTTGAGTTTYAYDDADRLTEVDPPAASPVAYTWDDNGNLTDRGSDAFSWDYEDRMVQATVNSVTTSFVYRGDGLRDSRAVSGGATTTFTWDIASGLPVVLDDGNQYVYGAGLTSMKQGGNWYYYLADGLGSTMAVVDSSGNSQKSYTYDVYGEATPSGGLANEFDFAGQQTDGTGLQYLRARYMDPETGTFLSREPLAVEPHFFGSGFVYALGSPTSVTDPTGFEPCYDDYGNPQPPGSCINGSGQSPRERGVDVSCTYGCKTGPGEWVKVNRPSGQRYQGQVSGTNPRYEYRVKGVHFDGFKDGRLLEAKGPGYDRAMNNAKVRKFITDDWLRQAQRQLEAARGTGSGVDWHFAEYRSAQIARTLFEELGLPINVIWTPAAP